MSAAVILLVLSLLGLLTGPVLVSLWPAGRAWRALLDGLSLVVVVGLSLLVLLPHAVAHSGLLAVAVGALSVGAFRLLDLRAGASLGRTVLLVVLLLVHAALDGAALAVAEEEVGGVLGLAVAAHRVPVGLMLFLGASSRGVGWGRIGLLSVATVLGFWGAQRWVSPTPSMVHGVLEALAIGALLHIALHSHPLPADSVALRRWSSLGGLVGSALVVVLAALSWDWSGCS